MQVSVPRASTLLQVIFVSLTLFLSGCKMSLDNGEFQVNLNGAAGSEKLFSFEILGGGNSFMAEATGSDSVYIQLLDADNNSITSCSTTSVCVLEDIADGIYTLKLKSDEEYTDVSLTVAWGNSVGGSLVELLPLPGLSGITGSAQLQSFYVAGQYGTLVVEATGSDDISLQVLDTNGELVGECEMPIICPVNLFKPGLIYIKIVGEADFTGLSLAAQWIDGVAEPLDNGVTNVVGSTVYGLHWERFVIPENTSGFLVDVSTGVGSYFLDVFDGDGNPVSAIDCADNSVCVEQPEEGVYYAVVMVSIDVSHFSVVATWGSENNATLENSVILGELNGVEGDSFAQSLYIPAGVSGLYVNASWDNGDYDMEIVNQNGNTVMSCTTRRWEWSNCYLIEPTEGLYYVTVTLLENVFDLSVVAAWGGPELSAIQSGVPIPITGSSVYQGAHSFYVDSIENNVTVENPSFDLELVVRDVSGDVIRDCAMEVCIISDLPVGLYYLILFL